MSLYGHLVKFTTVQQGLIVFSVSGDLLVVFSAFVSKMSTKKVLLVLMERGPTMA